MSCRPTLIHSPRLKLTPSWCGNYLQAISLEPVPASRRGVRTRAERGVKRLLKPAVTSQRQRGSVFIVSNLGIHYSEYFRSNKTIFSVILSWNTEDGPPEISAAKFSKVFSEFDILNKTENLNTI